MNKFLFLIGMLVPLTLSGQTSPTLPEKSLQALLAGNKRYVNDQLEHPNHTSDRREEVTNKQNPFAVIIGCSDSRVPPEILFDQGVGDLFVVRVAGNVLGPIELASVEYSVHALGSSLILVLGHENCGAVKAVLNNQSKDIEPIAIKIQQALKDVKKGAANPLEQAIKANVHAVVSQLRQDPELAQLISERKLGVSGGYYHLGSGEVELCCDLPEHND